MKSILLLVAGCLCLGTKPDSENQFLTVNGRCDFLKEGDTVGLIMQKYGSPLWYGQDIKHRFDAQYITTVKGHTFYFKVPAYTTPFEISLNFGEKHRNKLLIGYLAESGDSIEVDIANEKITFSGRGSVKWNLFSRFKDIDNACQKTYEPLKMEKTAQWFDTVDSAMLKKMALIEQHKDELTNATFILSKGMVLGNWLAKETIYFSRWLSLDSMMEIGLHQLKERKTKNIIDIDFQQFNKNEILMYSSDYAEGVEAKYYFDSCINVNRPFEVKKCYDFIVKNYEGKLKERLSFNLIYGKRDRPVNISAYMKDALTYIKNKDLIEVLTDFISMRTEGASAYNFSLPDTNGKIHKLTDYRGRVIFIDFWTTFCGNCIEIAPFLAKIEQQFKDKPVTFMSINCDKDKRSWMKSLRSGKYTSEDIVNVFTEGKGEKHDVVENFAITAFPTLVIIDRTGNILPVPMDPRIDSGKHISDIINKAIQN